MFGSLWFRWVNGSFYDHVGWLATTGLWMSASSQTDVNGVIQRGTFVQEDPNNPLTDMVLASGDALGILTQDVNAQGLTGLQGFKDFSIGRFDRMVQQGIPVAIRQPEVGSQMEIESGGCTIDGLSGRSLTTAVPGNCVCTSGTGSLSVNTAINTELSVLNGCLRAAQSGDKVIAILRDPTLTPLASPANLRIRIEFVGRYKKP